MRKIRPPFKLAIAAAFLDCPTLSAPEVFDRLCANYSGERVCTEKNIDDSLQSLKAVGILKVASEDDLHVHYTLSANGRERVSKAL